MPLVRPTLQAGILSLLESLALNENPVQARQEYAEKLSTLIDLYIKSAIVVGTSPGGPVTGTLQ